MLRELLIYVMEDPRTAEPTAGGPTSGLSEIGDEVFRSVSRFGKV
jgi:hypothetical protein